MSLDQKLYCQTLGCKMAYSLKGIKRQLQQRFSQKEINLTLEQYFILNILDNEEGLILNNLAEILDRDKSAVLRHIDCLEKKHFAARASDPKDKRRKILLVTKKGLQELQKARTEDRNVHHELTQSIDNEKLEAFEDLLAKIYERAML